MNQDITIFKRARRAYAVGETRKGKSWLSTNIVGFTEHFSMDVELVEDFAADIRKAGLSVEIK